MKSSKINKIKTIILTIFLLLAMQSIAFSSENDLNALKINLINQNPDPVYAGNTFEITIGLENVDSGTTDNVILELKDEFPFTIISENRIELGTIFSSSDYIYNQKIKLKVDSSTKAGSYILNISFQDYPIL